MLAGTLFAAPRMAAQQKPAARAAVDSLRATLQSSSLTFQQQKNINDALRQRGQAEAARILGAPGNHYSRQLDTLERRQNAYVQDYLPNKDYRVLVMDPLKYYALRGLGFTGAETAGRMLQFKEPSLRPDDKLNTYIADCMEFRNYTSLTGDQVPTQFPMAIPLENTDTQGGLSMVSDKGSLIVPVSDFAPIYRVPGMKGADCVDYSNRHEGWHTVHWVLAPGIDVPAAQALDDAPRYRRKDDANYLSYFCMIYNNELFADIAATGDMVHAGKSPDMIDKVAAFRLAYDKADETHMSVPGLRALSDRLAAMGLETFRAMDVPQRLALYEDITAAYAMTPERLCLAYDLLGLRGSARDDLMAREAQNPELQKALVFAQCLEPAPAEEETALPAFTTGDDWIQAATAEVSAWDARKALLDRAAQDSGRITPVTLAQAYMTMMTADDDVFYSAESQEDRVRAIMRMIKMTRGYLDMMPTVDYVSVNMQRGIDILSVETGLAQDIDRDTHRPYPANLSR